MRTAAETLARLQHIFEALIELPPGPEQEATALRLSGGDCEIVGQALALAAAHLRRELLNRTAQQQLSPEQESGRLYGRYRTIRRIGSGGMGTVFLAHRADGEYSQTGALKIIHPTLAPELFYRRFLEERQILATLNHPGITKILDGGVSESGTPYLVMEYVEGQPLDLYCAHHRLDLRARLELFCKVAEPVAYAHRSLVMHRDLKPSNILVTPEGNPVLLDFGTARFLGTAAPEEYTAFPLLTLRYSSPEQRSRAPLTTATDVFSLGVILYELVTGHWPFGDASSAEGLMKSFGGKTTMTPPAVPGDLAAILTKALAPVPEDRYRGVDAFSADVRNYLRGSPVNAKPAGLVYRARKFVGRNMAALVLGGVVVAALLGTTGFALYQARLARDSYTALRSITTSLLFDLKNAINDVPGSTAAQKILIDRVLKNLENLTRASTDLDLQLQLAEAYRQLGELQGDPYSQNLGDGPGALESLAKGRKISEAALRRMPSDAALLHLAGMVEITAAETYLTSGDGLSNAVACAKRATDYYQRMIPVTKNPAWLSDAASAWGVFGDIYSPSGVISLADPAKAIQAYRRSIDLQTAALAVSPASVRALRGIAVMRMKLGDLARPKDPQLALEEFRAASLALTRVPPAEGLSPTIRRLHFFLLRKTANALRDMQDWAESENALAQVREYSDRQLSADSNDQRAAEDVAVAASDQAYLFLAQRKYRDMLQPAATVLRISEQLNRRQPNDLKWQLNLAYSRVQLAIAQYHLGQTAIATTLARSGVNELIRLAELSNASPHYLEVASEWLVLAEPREHSDPQRAILYARKFLSATRSDNVAAQSLLAYALQAAGQSEEAKSVAKTALSLLKPTNEPRESLMHRDLISVALGHAR